MENMDPTVRPGGVLMLQLLMKDKCENPSIERMTEVLSRHIGRVEAAKPTDKMADAMERVAVFAALEHIGHFRDDRLPAREVVGAGGLTAGLADTLIDRVYVYPGNRVDIIWEMKDFCMEL